MLNRSQSEITCSVVQITGSLVAQFDEWAFDDGMGLQGLSSNEAPGASMVPGALCSIVEGN